MGRWLMALLVMLTSLATKAAQAYPYAVYTPSNTTLTFYYDDQYDNRTGTVYDLPVGGNYPDWLLDGTYGSITRVVFNSSFAQTAPSNTSFWFFSMANLQSITGMKQYLNTSQVTDMSYMFGFCQKLASIDLSNFNTANVTKMKIMFSDCLALTSLDVSGFNTSKVIDMSGMFYDCSSLTSLDVSSSTRPT